MATLKSLVDETSNIKNELKTCHTNLKNNLVNKGVNVSNSDKFSSLINKVKDISIGKKWASGSNVVGSNYKYITGYNYISTITASNLGFKPSLIYIYLSAIDDRPTTIYDVELFGENSVLVPYKNTQGKTIYNLRTLSGNNAYVNNTGFKLPIHTKEYYDTDPTTPYTCVKWIAFE